MHPKPRAGGRRKEDVAAVIHCETRALIMHGSHETHQRSAGDRGGVVIGTRHAGPAVDAGAQQLALWSLISAALEAPEDQTPGGEV